MRGALTAPWLTEGLEDRAVSQAITSLARGHLDEVGARTENRVAKTVSAVRSRLTHEIAYWDHRADDAAAKEQAGRSPGELNSTRWRLRATDLSDRLARRLAELELERRVTSLAPVVVGGSLVIPAGMLVAVGVRPAPEVTADPEARTRVELLAMAAVMAAERAMGHEPIDVSADKAGYDILSRTPDGLRFVEVKGRAEGATTITVTRGEIQACLNEPEKYWLAVVNVKDDAPGPPTYLVTPFRDRVPFAGTSVNFSIRDLYARGPENPVCPSRARPHWSSSPTEVQALVPPGIGSRRPGTPSRTTIADKVEATRGRISAKRLLPVLRAEGYTASARTLQRAVHDAKAARRKGRREYRPWVPLIGEHLAIDWGEEGGLKVFCAVLAWSRWRFVRLAAREDQATTLHLLAECFEALGGVPAAVPSDTQRASPRRPSAAKNKRRSATTVRPASTRDDLPFRPGLMSRTRRVPLRVPSLTHSSRPCVPSSAVKSRRSPSLAKSSGGTSSPTFLEARRPDVPPALSRAT